MDIYAAQALEEYNSNIKTTRRGGNGKPFWNINSSQFMFAPSFQFPHVPGCKEYIFTATDSNGKEYSFVANSPTAPLTPIWKDILVGVVCLKVEAVHKSNCRYLAGARTFYKTAPFPGRDALPANAVSYSECALKALRYAFNDSITQHWLTTGKPKSDYYHSVYPSKMIAATVKAMLMYAQVEPKNAEDALKIAINAADYLISITYGESSPLEGLPPTYSFANLDREIVNRNAPAAEGRKDTVMMIYPAEVGSMYLKLEEITQNKKYFEMAEKIAEYYRKNILSNGSWYLIVSEKTGEAESSNYCCCFNIIEFLNNFYKRTREECWHILEKNHFSYIEKNCLENYNWEGQFEDSVLSDNFSNLSHYVASRMIQYIVNNYPNEKEWIEVAKELMRFVEDQFVVWGDFSPLNDFYEEGSSCWYSPAGLEQYFWHVPIDASTSVIARSFLYLYSVTKERVYYEKACALADSITRMQNQQTGVIPTHWMTKDCSENLKNFWMNCHVESAFFMNELAHYD